MLLTTIMFMYEKREDLAWTDCAVLYGILLTVGYVLLWGDSVFYNAWMQGPWWVSGIALLVTGCEIMAWFVWSLMYVGYLVSNKITGLK